jgi:hypothetical protein
MIHKSKYYFLIILLISCVTNIFLLCLNPTVIASDDSLFYAQIAYKAFSGLFPSFNGIEITNGFHPLNLLLLTTLRFFSGNLVTPEIFIVNGIIFEGILGIICCFQLWSYLSKSYNYKNLNCLIVAIFAFYIFGGMYLSEAHCNALILLTFLLIISNNHKHTVKSALLTGIICGLSILARLDNIFLVAFYLASYIFIRRINFLYLILPIITIQGTYFCWNYLNFSHLMPVSGVIKSTFPQIRSIDSAISELTVLGKLIGITLGFNLLSIVFFKVKKIDVWLFSISSLFLWWYYLLFQYASYHSWYYIQAVIALCISSPAIINQIKLINIDHKLFSFIALIFIIVLPIYGLIKSNANTNFNLNELFSGHTWKSSVSYATVGINLGKNIPKDSRIFAFDMPGYLAYFSGISITAHDCLTLSVIECQKMRNNLAGFLKKRKITHVVWPFINGCTPKLAIPDYFKKTPIGIINLNCSTAKVLAKDVGLMVVKLGN